MSEKQRILQRLEHYADCIDKGIHVTGSQLKRLVLDIREQGGVDDAPQPPAETQPVEPMTGDLLPCPFCGKSNQDRYPCEWLDSSGANVIRCAWCHGAAPMSVWNRRTPPPSAPVGVDHFRGVAEMVGALNPDAGEIGAGKLRQIVEAARAALAQQPAAVDEAMVERAMDAAMEIKHNKETWFPMTRRRMKRALNAALAAQQGGGDGNS